MYGCHDGEAVSRWMPGWYEAEVGGRVGDIRVGGPGVESSLRTKAVMRYIVPSRITSHGEAQPSSFQRMTRLPNRRDGTWQLILKWLSFPPSLPQIGQAFPGSTVQRGESRGTCVVAAAASNNEGTGAGTFMSWTNDGNGNITIILVSGESLLSWWVYNGRR